jgi:hypothetical protein
MNNRSNKQYQLATPPQLVKKIDNFFELAPQLNDKAVFPNLEELQRNCENVLRQYFLNLSSLVLLPISTDTTDPLAQPLATIIKFNPNDKRTRIAQFLAEHPKLDRQELILELEEKQKELLARFGKAYRTEVPSTKFILHLFNLRQTTTQAFYIYKIPFQNKYNNDIDLLKTYIGKLQGFENYTARKIDQLIDNFKIHAPMTTPTQVMKFKNCAILNGKLIPNTDHNLADGDFVVNSDLVIPDTIPQSVQEFINNFTTKNPEVHAELDQHRERPFLEQELAYMAYSCFARYKIGNNRSPFGAFFLFEDDDGIGGGKGKSAFTTALINVINSGIDDKSPSAVMAGSLDPSTITTDQVKINASPRLLNNLFERARGTYSDEEVKFLKSMRETDATAIGKYQTQEKSVSFRGNVMISSNHIPRFREMSNALRERFYGIEFTLKFKERGNTQVDKLLNDPEFLGGFVRWAFSFGFDQYEKRKWIDEHFKEQFDKLMTNNNVILQNFYTAVDSMNQTETANEWNISKHNIASCNKTFFKEIFAEVAGSLVGGNKITGYRGHFASGEYQFNSWQNFTSYLMEALDNNTLKAINFDGRVKINGKDYRRFVVNLNKLCPMTLADINDTPTEKQWKKDNHYNDKPEDETVDTVIDYDEDNKPTTLESIIKQPEPTPEPTPIEKELEEPPIELDVEPEQSFNEQEQIEQPKLVEEETGQLEEQKGDVMARIENGEVELSEPDSPFAPLPDTLQVNDTNYTYRAYSDTVNNYIKDIQQILVEQMPEIEKSSGDKDEVDYLIYMLGMYVKSYCEITGDNTISVPLSYISQKVGKWKTSPFDYLKAYYTFDKNTLSIAQTRDGQMKLGFYARN